MGGHDQPRPAGTVRRGVNPRRPRLRDVAPTGFGTARPPRVTSARLSPITPRLASGLVAPCAESADVIHVPPLTGGMHLRPPVLQPDLVHDPTHRRIIDVDGVSVLVRGRAGRVGRRAAAI